MAENGVRLDLSPAVPSDHDDYHSMDSLDHYKTPHNGEETENHAVPLSHALRQLLFSHRFLVVQGVWYCLLVGFNAVLIALDVKQFIEKSTEFEVFLYIGDVFNVVMLLLDMAVRLWLHEWDFIEYWDSAFDSKLDVFVLVVSILTIIFVPDPGGSVEAYGFEGMMLALRVVRDAVRILRVIYFTRELRNLVVDFRRVTLSQRSSSRGELSDDASSYEGDSPAAWLMPRQQWMRERAGTAESWGHH